MPSSAAGHVSLLAAKDKLLIATTRTVEKYLRLGWLASRCRLAVCAGGGVLLDCLSLRPDWTAECLSRLKLSGWSQHSLDRALSSMLPHSKPEDIEGAIGLAARRTRWIPDADCHGEFLRAANDLGLCGSWTGTKAYLQVRSIDKEGAVRWALGSDSKLVAAAGDSELDRGLLEMANSSFIPPECELSISPSSGMNAVSGASLGAIITEISLRLLESIEPNSPNPE